MTSVAAFCLVLVLHAPEQGGMVEAARLNGGKAVASLDVNAPKPGFDMVARESTLIVRGTVTRVTTRLSDDGNYVLTEFEIIPAKVYKGTVGDVVKAPGPTKPLVVRRPGGTVKIDGLEMTVHANQYPERDSLRENEEVFLFLSGNASTNVFDFTGGPYGAYRIAAGKVTAMTRWTAAERGEEPQAFEAFESRVLHLIIAQALAERMDLVTKDRVFRKYGVKVVW